MPRRVCSLDARPFCRQAGRGGKAVTAINLRRAYRSRLQKGQDGRNGSGAAKVPRGAFAAGGPLWACALARARHAAKGPRPASK